MWCVTFADTFSASGLKELQKLEYLHMRGKLNFAVRFLTLLRLAARSHSPCLPGTTAFPQRYCNNKVLAKCVQTNIIESTSGGSSISVEIREI